MKKLIWLLLLLPCLLQGQNRVATLSDVIKYGSYIQAGDLIMDTPTKKYSDNINQLTYTSIAKSFPGLREDGTIWIDGTKLGSVCEFRFLNIKETTPWLVSNVTFRPIPGTYVQGIYTSNSYGGFLYLIQGVKNLVMDGTSQEYTGLSNLQKGDFLTEQFGFRATSNGIYTGYHVYSISVLGGGTFTFKGLEGEHGFSVMRFQGGSYDNTVSLVGSDSYFHDSSSELMYIGATHGPPYSKIKVDLSNLILARSGSESLQLQHLIDGSWVRNITIYSATAGYINEFQPFQDTGIQISSDGGKVVIENITLDSWGSHGINIFGADYVSTIKNTTIRNIAMSNGRGPAIYFHNSDHYGMKWMFNNISIWNQNWDYYNNNKTAKPNWTISTNAGTDTVSFNNVNYSGSATLFQNLSKINVVGTAKMSVLPSIDYVNSGFYEPANKIVVYNKYYGKYFSGADTVRVRYRNGDIIIDREPGFKQVFTKALNDFTATNLAPKNDKINCLVLSWDSNGVRNDQISWCGTCTQRAYPPDDLRIRYNNFYGGQGMGFVEQVTIESLEQQLSVQAESFKTQLLNQQVLFDQQTATQLAEYQKAQQVIIDLQQQVDSLTNRKNKYESLVRAVLTEMEKE